MGEKKYLKNFLDFFQNGILVCSGVLQEEFLKTVENRLQIVQPGSEEHFIKIQKGGTPMKNLLTPKTKGGNHNARFYDRAEGTVHLVPLDLG